MILTAMRQFLYWQALRAWQEIISSFISVDGAW
jgi:hypothetical protein